LADERTLYAPRLTKIAEILLNKSTPVGNQCEGFHRRGADLLAVVCFDRSHSRDDAHTHLRQEQLEACETLISGYRMR
jgi:hypothetical protein